MTLRRKRATLFTMMLFAMLCGRAQYYAPYVVTLDPGQKNGHHRNAIPIPNGPSSAALFLRPKRDSGHVIGDSRLTAGDRALWFCFSQEDYEHEYRLTNAFSSEEYAEIKGHLRKPQTGGGGTTDNHKFVVTVPAVDIDWAGHTSDADEKLEDSYHHFCPITDDWNRKARFIIQKVRDDEEYAESTADRDKLYKVKLIWSTTDLQVFREDGASVAWGSILELENNKPLTLVASPVAPIEAFEIMLQHQREDKDGRRAFDQIKGTTFDAKLRIDSLNEHGTGYPYPDATAEAVKKLTGEQYPGKIIFMNDMDVDGDEIPDFLDGFMAIDGAMGNPAENAAEKITGGAFVKLVVWVSEMPANASLVFDYNANDPATVGAHTLEQAKAKAALCATGNPLNGSIRIWTKDANVPRNKLPVTGGGDFVTPNMPIPLNALGLQGNTGEVVLYVEGISTTPVDWGTDRIKLLVQTEGGAQPVLVDEVGYTVVRCVYKVCVYRPYTYDRNTGSRSIYRPNYDSPAKMLNSYATAQVLFDRYDGSDVRHNTAAFMGHAFAKVEIRTPGMNTSCWTGHTGLEGKKMTQGSLAALKGGTALWYRADDGEEDEQAKTERRYANLYAAKTANIAYWGMDKGIQRKLVAVREFRVMPKTAKTIDEFRTQGNPQGDPMGYPFGGYGLDVTMRTANDSRSGCGSYVGLMTQRSGLVTNTRDWTLGGNLGEKYMPVIPLRDVTYTHIGLGADYTLYLTGLGRPLRSAFRSIATQAAKSIANHQLSQVWQPAPAPVPNEVRPLNFFDPSQMADWIDTQNQSTPCKLDGLDYKDRGTEIRYDVPQTDDLGQWRNRPL